jgi:hypothetical protein
MRKAILTAFLLFIATMGPAVGNDLSDRFKNDFGDEPPVLPVPPTANPDLSVPPAANPDIKITPAPNPASPVVPMPRLRPARDIGPAAALPAALALPSFISGAHLCTGTIEVASARLL